MSLKWLLFWIVLPIVCLPAASQGGGGAGFAAIVMVVSGVVIYCWPILVAKSRNHRNLTGIILVTVLLGWTLVGWVVAAVWAYGNNAVDKPQLEGVPSTVTGAVEAQKTASTPDHALRQCPFCAEEIRVEAIKCKHCGSDVSATASS